MSPRSGKRLHNVFASPTARKWERIESSRSVNPWGTTPFRSRRASTEAGWNVPRVDMPGDTGKVSNQNATTALPQSPPCLPSQVLSARAAAWATDPFPSFLFSNCILLERATSNSSGRLPSGSGFCSISKPHLSFGVGVSIRDSIPRDGHKPCIDKPSR